MLYDFLIHYIADNTMCIHVYYTNQQNILSKMDSASPSTELQTLIWLNKTKTLVLLINNNIKMTPFKYSLGRYALIILFFIYWYIKRSCMIQCCILGVHYWYNTRKDMSCDEFYPVFLLYNGGQLNAFGWAFQAPMTSPHMEHPPKSTIKVC